MYEKEYTIRSIYQSSSTPGLFMPGVSIPGSAPPNTDGAWIEEPKVGFEWSYTRRRPGPVFYVTPYR